MPDRPQAELARDFRAMVRDAVFFSLMVGLGEAYVPAFVLAVGLGEVAAGWVATLPMLAGAVFQLVTPAAARRLGSYRRWVVLCARLQALSFVPLLAGALLGRIPVWVVFGAAAAYWGFGMATSPAWNAWVASLVPVARRARFFAHRTRWAQAALFASIVAAGSLLEWKAGPGRLAVFGVLFALAAAARWLSARALAEQSEPEGLARSHAPTPFLALARELPGSEPGRLLLYLLGMQVAVQVAGPFFTPYMLGHLGLSYASFTLLTGTAFLARIAALPLLGRWAHVHGATPLVRIGALIVVPLPALWLVSDQVAWLLALQVLSGVAWATLELGTLLSFFERIADRDRASVLTLFNFAHTLAMALGALLGGILLHRAAEPAAGYALLFLLSAAGRLAVVPLLPRHPLRVIPPEGVVLRTLAVRPAVGAIQRPIIATLETGPEAGSEVQPAAPRAPARAEPESRRAAVPPPVPGAGGAG